MSKFYYKSKLSRAEQEELLIDFCDAISSIKDSSEAAKFLKDLLSPQEVEMLAKRIKVAELLLKNWNYKQIAEILKVGESTIARVSEWLKLKGDGYRLIIKRLKDKQKERKIEMKNELESESEKFKRRRPLLFWPELLIKDLIKSCNIADKEKKKILKSFEEIKEKPELFKKIEKEMLAEERKF